ncbi:amino acid adenylation domain-containing protein [Streptomyces litchfieldiae]|uniref:Amino acid adenylation domain-containing protein n=1 Tax=Streptomyces litchfieldiae TaxID=3075543 RepID=A0ABU2N121_9ACTN|nr:amino acid adenylation domain-containing protein [Streptomyces sp. DSM 44938]MDT0347446.1 amino acid adenylation domain-containing protein [Streptomyces sp. DSM 44938]
MREDILRQLPAHDQRLFQLFGQGPVRHVPHACIHHAIEEQAAARPLAVAAEHLDESITYGELDRKASQLAAQLAELGVRPGDRVALFVRRSIPMLIGLLATLKAGAAYVPQDVRMTPSAQLRHVVRVTNARVILTLSSYADRVLPLAEGRTVLAVDDIMGERRAPGGPLAPVGMAGPDDGCYVLFTSGTTGRPNGVTVTHRNVCNLLLTEPGDLGIRPGDRVAQILNIAFDMAAWEILGSLSHGATLVIRGRDIGEAALDAQVVIATPTILSGIDPGRCRRIRTVAVAGEPCPRPLADRWAGVCTFYNGCGPTETTIVNTMQRHTPSAVRLTIGRPTPNNTVYVLDEHRRPLAIGEVGEMWAGGDGVSAGYLDNPELNAERYAPDPFLGAGHRMFRTRDLGRWTPDGELEHLGRTDDQVKIRGFRVELDSVSAVLESLPGCVRAATVKLDDQTLVSFVSPGHLSPEEARAGVAAALPYYCVPTAVHTLEVLPRTSRGKIDKAALLRLAAAS